MTPWSPERLCKSCTCFTHCKDRDCSIRLELTGSGTLPFAGGGAGQSDASVFPAKGSVKCRRGRGLTLLSSTVLLVEPASTPPVQLEIILLWIILA